MYDYVIGVGGTGARCLEAISYMMAAGLFTRPIYALIIDPDQNNGNGKKTVQVMRWYHHIQQDAQPSNPVRNGMFGAGRKPLDPPVLFKASLNNSGRKGEPQYPLTWDNPNAPGRKFGEAIDFSRQATDFQDFFRLFYQEKDLRMPLNIGYRGRTSIGAVALKIDLTDTVERQGGGLHELVLNLQADLQNGTPRIFVAGSVFGGTGAAALPTIPTFMNNLKSNLIGPNKERLQFGCAMLIPYFSFPKARTSNTSGPVPDSDEHMIATKAALLHYAHVPTEYKHVYLIGAPEQYRTATNFEPGDEPQANSPHYVEFISALAALDFFNPEGNEAAQAGLHFANDVTIIEGQPVSNGISWSSLPSVGQRQVEIKRKLIAFSTFAYFYKNFLHRAFVDRQNYTEAPWFKDNFRPPLTLSGHRDALDTLYKFSDSFLTWLHAVGGSGGAAMGALFRWEGLLHSEALLCASYVGYLTEAEMGSPRYAHEGYHQILKRMDSLILEQPGTQDPPGLFIYLLYQAVEKFCEDNYQWAGLMFSANSKA
jgi:hypothetical protein